MISVSSAAMNWSPGPTRWSAGTQKPMTSTSSSVSRTRSLSRSPRSVRGLCRPGVSTRTSWLRSLVTIPRIVCRVVCGLLDVMATLLPTRALVSVDLPAFGRPTRQANPATYPSLAHPARSSSTGSALPVWLLDGLDRLDDDGGDAVPATGHPLRGEAQPGHLARRPEDGHPPDRLRDEAADRVDLVLVEVHLEHLTEIVDVHRRRHPHPPVPEVLDLRCLAVVLVGDLADDLLEDVLDGHEPRGAAVLVDDDGEVGLVALHLARAGRRPACSRARTASGA